MKKQRQISQTLIDKAIRRANKYNETYIIAEIDFEDDRKLEIWKLKDTNLDEFIAFEGVILAIAYPSGSFELL